MSAYTSGLLYAVLGSPDPFTRDFQDWERSTDEGQLNYKVVVEAGCYLSTVCMDSLNGMCVHCL